SSRRRHTRVSRDWSSDVCSSDLQPLLVLRQLREEGKINLIGLCTPEQDQNCVIQLMRDGLVDVVQVIYNLFDQEAAAQIFSTARSEERRVGKGGERRRVAAADNK